MVLNNSPPYRAIVIGLGQIGQGYDYNKDNSLFLTTHASAYQYHSLFELVGGVDLNPKNCQLFEEKYQRPTFNTVAAAMDALNPVVASVATPTDCHLETFTSLLPYSLRAVVLEKPIAGDIVQARQLTELAKDHSIAVLVNYVRRYEPGTQELRKMISSGLIGDVYKGIVYYGKGFLNNGSHFVDLLTYLLGPPALISIVNSGRSINVSGVNDHEADLVIAFGGVPVIFLSTRYECVLPPEGWSFRLFAEKGIVLYGAGEIKYQVMEQGGANSDNDVFNFQYKSIDSDFDRYQYHVISALGTALLEGKERDQFDNKGALEILKLFRDSHD